MPAIEEKFRKGVVNCYHWNFQLSFSLHCFQPSHASRRLLASSSDFLYKSGTLGVSRNDKFSSVVNQNVRTDSENFLDVSSMVGGGDSSPSKHGDPCFGKCSCYIILSRQRIAASYRDLGACLLKVLRQNRR